MYAADESEFSQPCTRVLCNMWKTIHFTCKSVSFYFHMLKFERTVQSRLLSRQRCLMKQLSDIRVRARLALSVIRTEEHQTCQQSHKQEITD